MDDVDAAPEAVVRAAEELYGLPPGDFTARRTALAGELRKAGDRPAAGTIAGLRRPTVAAWLVNRLARDDGIPAGQAGDAEPGRALLDRLLELGEQTRQAQAALDGSRIRELGRSRQPLVASLVRRAGELGEEHGQQVAAGVQRELEETFGAAIADPAAAAAVTSGMLTRALAYAGLGDVDLDAATALTVPPGSALAPRPAAGPKAPAKRRHLTSVPDADDRPAEGADRDRREQERAEQQQAARRAEQEAEREAALAGARAEADAAEQALTLSLEKQQQAQDRERELTQAVDRLQDELARARRDLVTASHAVGAAERDVIHRERTAREARKALSRAEQSAAEVQDP